MSALTNVDVTQRPHVNYLFFILASRRIIGLYCTNQISFDSDGGDSGKKFTKIMFSFWKKNSVDLLFLVTLMPLKNICYSL